jgi:outer membrane lipoprotein
LVASLLLLAGCASKLPQEIRQAPPDQPTISQARQQAEGLTGRTVRWGGELVTVTNRTASTELEILGRPLDRDGEPDTGGEAQGRFFADYEGFLDPADYLAGQRVTVSGTLRGVRQGYVGEYPYRYPVVAVSTLYRWPEPQSVGAYPPAYWWPYYDPWWPHRYAVWPYTWSPCCW